ncbi:hypothetical protein [Enterobacter hormaechei]|nr:hypothetical protein [Enterobacter hormaechei]KAA0880065.1 hypothetical protein EYC94_17910 [Enterobacter hormaechei]MCL1415761.1 hypothetical protein [Enterobacter hormaechei]MCL1420892.1 hypothetical protein [Enterobacter hormaechei]MCM8488099.1 hypothetical protein [Enterobacter hormaechei]MCW4976794.1 hypothetical protein [Enterobacter hormaechei subsp. xiangfangensis]
MMSFDSQNKTLLSKQRELITAVEKIERDSVKLQNEIIRYLQDVSKNNHANLLISGNTSSLINDIVAFDESDCISLTGVGKNHIQIGAMLLQKAIKHGC